jgi:hypothetical protein
MKNFPLPLFFFLTVVAIAITLACGSPASRIDPSCSSVATATNGGIPQSITLCPAVADAKAYPNGQVQFIATGYYSTQPSPVTPLQAFWGACDQNAPTSAVTISNSGLAQCAAGSSGTYDVFASEPTVCNAITACGGGCQVSGYAKLTCP